LSYEFLSDDELHHELELTSKQFQKLRQQLERLTSLKGEGKVSDVVFREVLEDISNKCDAYTPKHDELKKSAEDRIGRMKEEQKALRHDLESLEVRYTIGSTPEEQYKVSRATYIMRLQSIEEFSGAMAALIGSMDDDLERVASIVNQYRPITAPEKRAVPVPVSETAEVKPIVEPLVTPAKTTPAPTEEKKEVKVRICSRCGAENPETSLYCYNCGAKLG